MAQTQATREFDGLVEALRVAVPALHRAGVPFLLGGSMAVWAHGGPEPTNDLDLMLREQDTERALAALAAAGMRTEEHPPEEWLVKAWHRDVLVDLIFGPRGLPIDDDALARGQELSLCALRVPVMPLEDVLTTKLLSLGEHQLDLAWLLQISRAVREQVDWDVVRRRTDGSPYAAAFMTLVERLGIVSPAGAAGGQARGAPRVSVR
ncbi:MAG TPA: nucleotidyltransferase [Conexibacter sp.]|nr:nucleotidyltransferase [Conexibacter sp.]